MIFLKEYFDNVNEEEICEESSENPEQADRGKPFDMLLTKCILVMLVESRTSIIVKMLQ